MVCVSPAIAIDVNVNVQCTAVNLNTDNNDCNLRTYNGQILDPERRIDRRSTVFDDDFLRKSRPASGDFFFYLAPL